MKASPNTLYAWSSPVRGPLGSVVDHTWVTSQPKVLKDPPPKHYWYCAGVWRPTRRRPGGFVGAQPGDIRLARCIDTPNVPRKVYFGMPSADIAYLIDGVCHQIANRILWATVGPLVLDTSVRGYAFSRKRYGVYGRHKADWHALLQERCSPTKTLTMEEDDQLTYITSQLDDLSDEQVEALDKLEKEVDAAYEDLDDDHETGRISLDEFGRRTNAINSTYMQGLADILSREQYRTITGFEPEELAYLIDPALYES